MSIHERFQRKVWAFKADFTGALAKWLVKQSPYIVPDNLGQCIKSFHDKLDAIATFDINGMAEIDLSTLTTKVNKLLESIPEIMALNERKNGNQGDAFVSRHSAAIDPDNDFISIMAVAQNITCEFAEAADAECYLDSRSSIRITNNRG